MANVICDIAKAREIDKNEKNKFRCEWLAKTVTVKHAGKEMDVIVGDTIQKVDVSGKTICSICSDLQYYGKRGFSAISDHLKSGKHAEKVILKDDNYSFPSSFFADNPSTSSAPKTNAAPTKVNVPICDRVSNSEALILGVLAENNLPFSMAPVLVEVGKTLAEDRKALNHLSIKRNCAAYKMRFGVAKTFFQETLTNLENMKFSLNVDESTSNNHMRVVTVLTSYFSPLVSKVVIEHLTSLSVTTVTAETLYNEIVKFFESNQIPWENLMSILMDSCKVMRGTKSGLETRIREQKAPHLLDIDGDSCHHVHNACKKFCLPFENWLEKLLRDIFNDLKWSADIKEFLSEVCSILSIKYISFVDMISHRWLSCYDAAMSMLHLLDAITILYYGFLNNNDKTIYFSTICSIYQQKNIDSGEKAAIRGIHKKLSMKLMTDDGKKRKERITEKLFHFRRKTLMILHFYIAALPLLKKYVCLFQSKEPLIHKVYDEQKQLFLDFLSCFMKQELLHIRSTKDLLDIDILNESSHLNLNQIFIGAGTQSVISKGPNDEIKEEFLAKAKSAYVQCANYLQKKLPLSNPVLKCISSIDPTARGHEVTLQRLQKLPSLITNVLTNEDVESYSFEVHQYQVDLSLPSPVDDLGQLISLDIWWSKIFRMEKYPSLSKMVKSILSCFHGPQVEGSFNIMSDVIDKRSGRMNIETYSSIQTVKYKMRSREQSAVEYFKKKDFLHDAVDANLCRNLRSSRKSYQTELENKKKVTESRKKVLTSKKENVDKISTMEKASRLKHKRKLELLVNKIKNKKLKK